jgi:hypothetical protein
MCARLRQGFGGQPSSSCGLPAEVPEERRLERWLIEILISVVPGERSETRDPYRVIYRGSAVYGSPPSRGRQVSLPIEFSNSQASSPLFLATRGRRSGLAGALE